MLGLTDTLNAGYDLAALLCDLTAASVDLLNVDSAAVLLVNEGGRLVPVAATHDSSEQLDTLQVQTGHGPCLDCVRTETVTSFDVDRDPERWREFSSHAHTQGFRVIHVEPLRLRTEVIGGLCLFRRTAGALSDTDQRDARHLATAAATGVLHRRALHRLETVNGQLEGALASRILIEQAKGALAERSGLEPDVAFTVLRDYARRQGLPIRQIAQAIIDRKAHL